MADQVEENDLGFIPAAPQAEAVEDLGFVPEAPTQKPDMSAMKAFFDENLAKQNTSGEPQEAKGFLDYVQAGWQMSVSGLIKNQKNPEMVLPKDASMAANIVSGISTLAGDLPAIIPGFFAGGAAGSAVAPGPGTVVGAGAGAMALPAAARKALMDHYEKGDIQSFNDFYERSSSVLWESLKQGVVGGATAGAGGLVSKVVAPAAGSIIGKLAAPAAEVATMTTVGAAVEGHMPDAEDFTTAGLMVATIHGLTRAATGGTSKVSAKMREIYAKTDVKPEQIVQDAKVDPVLQQQLASVKEGVPAAYKEMIDPAVAALEKKSAASVKEEPPVKVEKVERTDAEKAILGQLGEREVAKKGLPTFDDIYTATVDKLNPIKKADPESYKLARMANDYKAKAKHIVEKGTLDYKTLEINGKGVREIIDPVKADLQGFEAFLLSKRALDYEARGLNSGFDIAAAKEVASKGEAKFGKAAKELVEFQRRNLEYIRDAGIISKDSFNAMVKAGESYIPLKRIIEPEANPGTVKTKGGLLKRVKGVDENVDIKTVSPLVSILENTQTFLKAAERNRAVESFVSNLEKSGEKGLIEKSQNSVKPVEITPTEAQKLFKEHGIEDVAAEGFTVFRGQQQNRLASNEFEVFRNGKREVYKTREDIAEAFKALDGDATSMNMMVKIMRGVTAVKRIGITLTPDFVIKNMFRDQLTSGAFSKGSVIPFLDVVSAIGDLVKKNEHYYNWMKSGGAQGSFLELNERYLMKDVFKLGKETGFLESTWNVAGKPIEYAKVAASLIELAPRLAEFKRVSQGAKSGAKVFEGGFAAREVTLDFQRIGAKMSALNSITAFQNAAIQGVDKTVRAFKENPVGTTTKAMAYITAPSVLLWWANKDDERYKAVPQWEKDLYWHIITDDWQPATNEDQASFMPDHLVRVENGQMFVNKGVTYRLAKPQELGMLFGTLPTRLLEKYINDNPKAMKDFDKTLVEMLVPNIIPDAITPVVEQWANKSLFTNREIIPNHLEKIAPQYQYTEYTSETAKQIAKLTPYLTGNPDAPMPGVESPMFFDNYVKSWGGALGQYALELADKGLVSAGMAVDNKPEKQLGQNPFVKAFVTKYPSAQAQQISEFYDRANKVEQRIGNLKYLSKKAGLQDEYADYAQSMHENDLVRLTGTRKALANSRKLIQAITDNPEYTKHEKRQLIDSHYYMMIEAASQANQIVDEMDKSLQESENQIESGVQ